MSNHISLGLRALQKLGAPISRAEKFITWHGEKLEAEEYHRAREAKDEPITTTPDNLIGARKSYYKLYDHYTKLLHEKYSDSLSSLVASEFPKLACGMVGSAVHGMIHLGYGYDSKIPWFVCEGLAYLHYSNVPLNISPEGPDLRMLGCGDTDILDVVDELRNDQALIAYMNETIKLDKWSKRTTSDFQRKAGVLFTDRANDLARYAHKVKFPDHLRGEFNMAKVPALSKWLVDCAVIVYAIADRPNDFFLIHGVTCAWSVKNIVHLLTEVDQVLDTVRSYLCTLFAAYLAQSSPPLQRGLITNNPGSSYQWDDIVERAIQHDQLEEEHIYKLVQVCKEMSEENEDKGMDSLYRLAAYTCVTNPLVFG